MSERIARLRIELRELEPKIWRRIDMPLSTTLEALHEVIEMTMGWTFSHLWEFEIDGRGYGDPSFREFDDEPAVYKAKGLRLGTAIARGADRFVYVYDYGDNWRHEVIVEEVRDGGRFTSTPEVAVGFSEAGPDYILGWRLLRGGDAPDGGVLEIAVEARRRESASGCGDPSGHAVGVRMTSRFGGTGRCVLKGARERIQRNFFRNCFWEMSLDLFGEPECGYWPQPQIGLALWSLSTTGDRWQDAETLMRLSVLPDEAVLRNPDWVAPVLFVLRLLRPLRSFGLVECRGEDATRRGHGEWRKTPLFDRFMQFDPELAGIGKATLH